MKLSLILLSIVWWSLAIFEKDPIKHAVAILSANIFISAFAVTTYLDIKLKLLSMINPHTKNLS